MAVVVAGELHDEIAAGECPREPDRRHRCLGARRDESHTLDDRHPRADLLRELGLPRGRRAERQATAGRIAHGLDDGGMRVTEEGGAPARDEVDVLASLRIHDPRAARRDDRARRAADRAERAHGRVDTAGEHTTGAGKEGGVRRGGTRGFGGGSGHALIRPSAIARAASTAQ